MTHGRSSDFYVGAARDVEARWRGHQYHAVNSKVADIWQSGGKRAFRFELLEECHPDQLVEREKFWFEELKPTLNVRFKPQENAYWRRGKKMHIKTEAIYNDGIDLAARLCGYPRGSGGNAKEMVEAIARGERFPIPVDWKGLDRALECDRLIRSKQPFKVFYKDSQSVERCFSTRFAAIKFHEKRFYLDCWAIETEDNQDLPDLRHNWCLRFDRILSIDPDPDQSWIEALDFTLVRFRLYGGMVKAYEKRPDDMRVERDGDCLVVDRAITNSFWFVRSVLSYGADCEVIAPDSLREQVRAHFGKALGRYQQ